MGTRVPPCCCPQPERQRQHGGCRRMRARNPTTCQELPTPPLAAPLFTHAFQHLSQAHSWMQGCSSLARFVLPKSQGLIRTSAKSKGRLPLAPSSLRYACLEPVASLPPSPATQTAWLVARAHHKTRLRGPATLTLLLPSSEQPYEPVPWPQAAEAGALRNKAQLRPRARAAGGNKGC